MATLVIEKSQCNVKPPVAEHLNEGSRGPQSMKADARSESGTATTEQQTRFIMRRPATPVPVAVNPGLNQFDRSTASVGDSHYGTSSYNREARQTQAPRLAGRVRRGRALRR